MVTFSQNSGVTLKRTKAYAPPRGAYKWNGATNGIPIYGDTDFIAAARSALDRINNLPTGQQILSIIDAASGPSTTTRVQIMSWDEASSTQNWCRHQNGYDPCIPASGDCMGLTPKGEACGSAVIWSATYAEEYRDPAIGLAHELIHAIHHIRGESLLYFTDPSDSNDNQEEARTIGMHAWGWSASDTGQPSHPLEPMSENKLRTEWNSQFATTIPMRTTHSSLCAGSNTNNYCPGGSSGSGG